MAEIIRVEPDSLREAAVHHSEAADFLSTVPSTHDAIQESLDSLGPIFGELREAGRELLEQRRLCYEQQAHDHATMAENLKRSADHWEEQEAQTAAALRSIHGDAP
jgi:Excreted virulence factor EspC, type VII ESX diderm